MYRWSPRFAFASLALVFSFQLATAQFMRTPEPRILPAPANGGPAVICEVQIARVSDELFAELSKEQGIEKQHLAVLDAKAAKACWEKIAADCATVKEECTIAMNNGEEGRVFTGSETPFVTDVKLVRFADQTAYVPQNQNVQSGSTISVVPTITPDGKHVLLRFNAELSEIPDVEVPLFPVTTIITPVFEGGAQGQPIPFTQFVQQPTVIKRNVSRNFGLAYGETAMVYGGHTSRVDKQVDRVPFWSDLPIIGELFERETEKQVSDHLIYLVTPRFAAAPMAPGFQSAYAPAPGAMPTSAPMSVVVQANGPIHACGVASCPLTSSNSMPAYGPPAMMAQAAAPMCMSGVASCPLTSACPMAMPHPMPTMAVPPMQTSGFFVPAVPPMGPAMPPMPHMQVSGVFVPAMPPMPVQMAMPPMAMPMPSQMPTQYPAPMIEPEQRVVILGPGSMQWTEVPSRMPERIQPMEVTATLAKLPSRLPEPIQSEAAERMVTLRCSIIKVDEAFFNRADAEAWADLSPKACGGKPQFLNDEVAQRFCCTLRAQKGGQIVSAPIVTTGDGQIATFMCAGAGGSLTSVSFEDDCGVTVPRFNKLAQDCGISCQFLARLSADGKCCNLSVDIDHTRNLTSGSAPCEVTVKIPAAEGRPEEIRTEMVYATKVRQCSINATQCVPCGRCVLVYFNKEETDEGVQHLAVLITPTVCDSQTKAATHPPTCIGREPASAEPKTVSATASLVLRRCEKGESCSQSCPACPLQQRLAQYRKACTEERWSDARRLAAECLELDPKCFMPK